MSEQIFKLLAVLQPLMQKHQNLKITKLHIGISNKEDSTYLVINTDEQSKGVASALVDILTAIVNMIKESDPKADVKVTKFD